MAVAALAVIGTMLSGESLQLQRHPFGLHRIVTCHFTHWTYEQLAWDALAFTALAIACARRNRVAFHATLLASVLLIPLAVLAFAPEVTAYRGLSGLASAMFALLLMLERSRLTWPVVVCATGFAAKLTFEAITGGTVFVNGMGSDVVSVPVAHLAGALIGAIGSTYTSTPYATRRAGRADGVSELVEAAEVARRGAIGSEAHRRTGS